MPNAAGDTDRSLLTPRPILTLTTDFGTKDFYVAAMKAVLVRECPGARLIDVTHHVPRHDILCGAITLERAVDGFPPGTVHLAVIDPGVGTDRRILVYSHQPADHRMPRQRADQLGLAAPRRRPSLRADLAS